MKKFLIILSLIFLPLFAWAATPPSFTEGVQYKTIEPNIADPNRFDIPKHKVLVVEFFSYGCPWCFKLEPTLEAWLKTKPKYVTFERIPVTFEQGWHIYAKAYYTAKALGISHKITPALFNAIHVKKEDLASVDAMQAFFASEGVNKKEFDDAFVDSPGLNIEMQQDKNLMMAYQAFIVPTIIVNGKYYTNAALVRGNDQLMMQVVNALVEKEKPTGIN